MNGVGLRMTSVGLCLFGTCALAWFAQAENQSYDVISQCGCAQPNLDPPLGCSYNYQCRVHAGSVTDQVYGLYFEVARVTATCSSCTSNCCELPPMYCVHTLSLAETETGTVSGAASFSTGFQGHINCLLAGGIQIQSEAQFNAGYTNSTTVSVTRSVACGSTSFPSCLRVDYHMILKQSERSARTPLYHTWYASHDCWGSPPSEWMLVTFCENNPNGWAAITGFKSASSFCNEELVGCGGDTTIDCDETPGPGGGGTAG